MGEEEGQMLHSLNLFLLLFYPPSFFLFLLIFPLFPSHIILGEEKTRQKEEEKKMIQMIINTQTTATTDYKHFRFPAARVVREIATCGWLVTLRLLQKKKTKKNRVPRFLL